MSFQAFLEELQRVGAEPAFLGSEPQLDLIQAFVSDQARTTHVRWLSHDDAEQWSHFDPNEGNGTIVVAPPIGPADIERLAADVLHETLHAVHSIGETASLYAATTNSLAAQLNAVRDLRDILEDERVMRRATSSDPDLAEACTWYRGRAQEARIASYEAAVGVPMLDRAHAVPILQLPIAVADLARGVTPLWAHENVVATTQECAGKVENALAEDKAAVEVVAVLLLQVFLVHDGKEPSYPSDLGAASAGEPPNGKPA